jgi:hypothetical protein
MTTEFRRLGKYGSYRLGRLRTQGVRAVDGPARFRPSFARNPRRGPASAWLLGLILVALSIAGLALAGWWFAPFVAGLAAGLANRVGGWRSRIALPAVAATAMAGWVIPLAWQAAGGQSAGRAQLRTLTGPLGLHAHASTAVALALIVAGVQAVAGYWLGRALTPRPLDG